MDVSVHNEFDVAKIFEVWLHICKQVSSIPLTSEEISELRLSAKFGIFVSFHFRKVSMNCKYNS